MIYHDYDDDRPWGPGCLAGLVAAAMPWMIAGGVIWAVFNL